VLLRPKDRPSVAAFGAFPVGALAARHATDRRERVTIEGRQVDRAARPHPGQKISSQGVPASSAAGIVGDHSISRPVASRRFQRSMTSSATMRAARSAFSLAAPALMSSPRVRTPI
jgi:hypothetical protein